MKPNNLQTLDLLADLPNYPLQAKIVRITTPAPGANVYNCYVQQATGALTFRDREAAYVFEPNGVVLGGGYYMAVLVHSYLGLPLFATTCCIAASDDQVVSGTGFPSGIPFSGTGDNGTGGGVIVGCCGETLSSNKCVTFTNIGGAPGLDGVKITLYFDSSIYWCILYTSPCVSGFWRGWAKVDICPNVPSGTDMWVGFSVGCSIDGNWYWGTTWQSMISGTGPPPLENIAQPVNLFDTSVCDPFALTVTSDKIGEACYDSPLAPPSTSVKAVVSDGACVASGAASGAASGTGGGGGGDIEMLGLGTETSDGIAVSSLTMTDVTVQTGRLVTVVSFIPRGAGISVTWNGNPLSLDGSAIADGSITGEDTQVFIYSASVTAGTGDIVVTPTSDTIIQMAVINIVNLPVNAFDVNNFFNGNSSAVTGNITTTASTGAIVAAATMEGSGGAPPWMWLSPFTSGGQDISETIGLNIYDTSEGRKITSAAGAYTAEIDVLTPAQWGLVLVAYK